MTNETPNDKSNHKATNNNVQFFGCKFSQLLLEIRVSSQGCSLWKNYSVLSGIKFVLIISELSGGIIKIYSLKMKIR